MITIDAHRPLCSVIVTMTCPSADVRDAVESIVRRMLPIFARQPGFVGMALHRSRDAQQLVTYLQWRSRADHDACQASDAFGDTGPDLLAYLASGEVSIDVRIHDVVAAQSAPDA